MTIDRERYYVTKILTLSHLFDIVTSDKYHNTAFEQRAALLGKEYREYIRKYGIANEYINAIKMDVHLFSYILFFQEDKGVTH